MIGAYDFVYTVQCPNNTCLAGTVDEPSVEDSNGHGSHTTSTVAGNAAVATFQGGNFAISGVARHANIIAYDACYTRTSDNGGLCPNVSTIAAINRAVADGVVDVINYSIGGGASPWTEATSQAFLNASNSGIYIATSAGNSGPAAATTGHQEPWVGATAATTHTRKFGFEFDMTGPAPVPANTQDIILGVGGVPYPTQSLVDAPLIVSPGFNSALNDDGCAVYPPGTFSRNGTPGIALVRFISPLASACPSGTRRTNVLNGGGAGLIFVTDTVGNFGANGTTWQMLLTEWAPVAAHLATDPANANATILAPFAGYPVEQPDVMADFSSRGPSSFDLLKPDIAAPGVNILAAYSGTSASFNSINGTSMASPHHAGAAVLMRALNPTWTPAEIKSALMMTATTAVLKEDRATPATPHDRGAGRVDLSTAAAVGLVLDETGTNYAAANPAVGGNPATLNLASMANDACIQTCSFTRTVSNARAGAATYSLQVSGALAAFANVVPASITLGTGDSRSFTVSVNSIAMTPGTFQFGELLLVPSNNALPTLHMPMAVRAAHPDVAIAPTSYSVNVAAGATTTRNLRISNEGNPTLNWSLPNTSGTGRIFDQPSQALNGIVSDFYNGLNAGTYAADDFNLVTPGSLTRIQASGFTSSGVALNTLATNITWRVYADNAGVPAGRPENVADPAPEYIVTLPVTSPAITYGTDTVAIDLLAAGLPPSPVLAAGRHWVMISPHIPGNTAAARWNWMAGLNFSGSAARIVSPTAQFGLNNTYQSIAAVTGTSAFGGLSLTLDGNVGCGAPWLVPDVLAGALTNNTFADVTLTFDATALAAGTYDAYLCVSSNGTDPDEPNTIVPVRFNVLAGPTNPTVTGAASPTSVGLNAPVLLTATVVPGDNPLSTGLTATADLAAIGGSATQTLFDNGSNGDAVPGDNVFSFAHVIPGATATGAKTLAVTVNDAQARVANTTIALTVSAPTNPSVAGRALPTSGAIGVDLLLTATVTSGNFPVSTGVAVAANLSAIGGSAAQVFVDNGTNGDITANDNVFSFRTTVAPGTTSGAKALPLTVTDTQSRTAAAANIAFTVIADTPLTGTGAAAPAAVARGAGTLLTVNVAAVTPASTGVRVVGDLTQIGGTATALFYNDGTHGDVVANDSTHSLAYTVPASATPGAYTLPTAIGDIQGRTGNADIGFEVLAPSQPGGVGGATPSTTYATGQTLLFVDVTPGTNPASTGITVSADLGALGGGATTALVDDGSNGDLVASDSRYSRLVTVAAGTTAGVKTLPVAIGDAQSRSSVSSIELTIEATTALSGTGSAAPANVPRGGSSLLTVDVGAGTNPPSTGIAVVADLSAIGSGSVSPMYDDGTHGDQTGGDGTWSLDITVAVDTPPAALTLPVSISDLQQRSASADIALTVLASTAPGGIGLATPDTVAVTQPTLLTVQTTAGSSPPSTGIGVSADLSSLGGAANQAFRDDGNGGDATAGDGIFSFQIAPAVGTATGAQMLIASITDAQLRSSTAQIALTVTAPGALSGIGAATPSTVARGASTRLTVTVSPGTAPASTGVAVSADLSSIGSGNAVAFHDDGSHGDQIAGDNVWTLSTVVPADTAPGAKSFVATISDGQGRTATANISLTVSVSTIPQALGAATPNSVGVGGSTLLTVTVTAGTSPASTGIAVIANLAAIGGSVTQTLFDDGSNGDAVAGDNVFSVQATIAAGTGFGVKTLPVSIVDAQLRTASTHIALTVLGEAIFADGFED